MKVKMQCPYFLTNTFYQAQMFTLWRHTLLKSAKMCIHIIDHNWYLLNKHWPCFCDQQKIKHFYLFVLTFIFSTQLLSQPSNCLTKLFRLSHSQFATFSEPTKKHQMMQSFDNIFAFFLKCILIFLSKVNADTLW